ncbi:MAG: type II toxin-antitoxin system Phd/YefM family antitoxin [Acidobacteria bacterium]|nr:type II toxin-antitoxin system Phd/YefM family antitoxin [Acidobacteriota bacterium]
MPKLTFRNSHGQLVDISTVAATQVKNEFGAILEHTMHNGAVAITRHDRPKAVLLSFAEFESLVRERSRSLDDLNMEFDGLLARMQTPESRKGVEAAFNASPAQLGRAAGQAGRTHHATKRKRPRHRPSAART